ncbi:hypothetical protein [Terasakiella pusilla]|uniref:hypothetical protein n=1 Tax=Terasakiella pusilla TaxID=64973 RepID=UPI003AA8ECBD
MPTKARSLVEFSNRKSGALALTDRINTEDGALTHAVCRTAIDFMVQYQGYWFAVHADQRDKQAVLRVHGIIGHLPYSYQSSFARSSIMTVVSQASRVVRGKVRIDEKQRILLIKEVKVQGSLTPRVIMSETAKVLLQLKPYLELVSSIRPPQQINKFSAPTHYRRQETPPPTA